MPRHYYLEIRQHLWIQHPLPPFMFSYDWKTKQYKTKQNIQHNKQIEKKWVRVRVREWDWEMFFISYERNKNIIEFDPFILFQVSNVCPVVSTTRLTFINSFNQNTNKQMNTTKSSTKFLKIFGTFNNLNKKLPEWIQTPNNSKGCLFISL